MKTMNNKIIRDSDNKQINKSDSSFYRSINYKESNYTIDNSQTENCFAGCIGTLTKDIGKMFRDSPMAKSHNLDISEVNSRKELGYLLSTKELFIRGIDIEVTKSAKLDDQTITIRKRKENGEVTEKYFPYPYKIPGNDPENNLIPFFKESFMEIIEKYDNEYSQLNKTNINELSEWEKAIKNSTSKDLVALLEIAQFLDDEIILFCFDRTSKSRTISAGNDNKGYPVDHIAEIEIEKINTSTGEELNHVRTRYYGDTKTVLKQEDLNNFILDIFHKNNNPLIQTNPLLSLTQILYEQRLTKTSTSGGGGGSGGGGSGGGDPTAVKETQTKTLNSFKEVSSSKPARSATEDKKSTAAQAKAPTKDRPNKMTEAGSRYQQNTVTRSASDKIISALGNKAALTKYLKQELAKTSNLKITSSHNNKQNMAGKQTITILAKLVNKFFEPKAGQDQKLILCNLLGTVQYLEKNKQYLSPELASLNSTAQTTLYLLKNYTTTNNYPASITRLFHRQPGYTPGFIFAEAIIAVLNQNQAEPAAITRSGLKQTIISNLRANNKNILSNIEKLSGFYLDPKNKAYKEYTNTIIKNTGLSELEILSNSLPVKDRLIAEELMPIVFLLVYTPKFKLNKNNFEIIKNTLNLNAPQVQLILSLLNTFAFQLNTIPNNAYLLNLNQVIYFYFLLMLIKLTRTAQKAPLPAEDLGSGTGSQSGQERHREKEDENIKEEELGPVSLPDFIDKVNLSPESLNQEMLQELVHEIRNQMTGIILDINNIKLTLDNVGFKNPDVDENILDAYQNFRQLKELINNILFPQKRSAFSPVKTNLKKILEETVGMLQKTHNNINFLFECPDDLEAHVIEGRLKQVIINLLINAAQAGSKNIHLRVFKNKKHVMIEVIDNGQGIAPENLARLFTESFTTKKSGRGIGLNVCREIITEHKGTIKVQSDIGKGTSFTLELPL